MSDAAGTTPRGGRTILRPERARQKFQVTRHDPAADLAAYAAFYWVLHWDLHGGPPHTQEVLNQPSVHMTFTTGGRARVVGIVPGVFTETIEGRGRVIGVSFRPGGFRPFLGAPVHTITDRFVPVEELFGAAARTAADEIIAAPETGHALALVEDLLRGLNHRPPDPLIAEVSAMVERIAADAALVRVDDLAAGLGIGVRRLQRLFADYVGIGPKWVIRRYRMQEAADRAAAGTGVDWAGLAADLGYADQAHFTRDFTATLGVSPTRYARECAPEDGGAVR